jgi:folate-dependent phosphoribosylglycinamide formyltransferase PurN
MTGDAVTADRPIRVVMFGSGPSLEYGVKQFLCHLEDEPKIELAGAFCQSSGESFLAIIQDLWRRRRYLALPLLVAYLSTELIRFLAHPRAQMRLNQQLKQLSDRIYFVTDIHSPAVLEKVRSLQADLGLIYGSPILKPELFAIPRYGTLGIHHGKVPQYRGKKTTFWAMYNGEETAGVTIQKVNAGLDTGEIVNQGEVIIGARSRGAVFNQLETLGINLFIQSILEVRSGTAKFRPQTGVKGKLYRDPTFKQIMALWWRQVLKRWSRQIR